MLLLAAAGAGNAGDGAAHANRLIDANDPYLLAHAHNPVDWYPWGPEALEKARRENKPIFLSVGYSTCYWCHVAERTIYSNPEIARLMNEWFVNIKVDREQRPDVDALYMLATRLMTGHGGWPNNIFLTPDLKPFFGGSYFPPEDDDVGRPGFARVLGSLHEAWTRRRAEVEGKAQAIMAAMERLQGEAAGGSVSMRPAQWVERVRNELSREADAVHGGRSGGDTRFPNAPILGLLLALGDPGSLATLRRGLDAMAYGGIHDHLGGGLHRYSIEPTWSIPHFEKMLYDNAQMLSLYARAWRATGDPLYRFMAEDIAAYVERRLTAPDGGFYAAEDAETRGREGASYVWRKGEIETLLGKQAARRFLRVYALTPMPARTGDELQDDDPEGVLRVRLAAGSSRPNLYPLTTLAAAREKLLAARALRAQPLRDEKIIVAWNGLMIEALADAGRIFGRTGYSYIAAARRAAETLWHRSFDPASGELQHELFRGRAQIPGYLDDYALFGNALLAVYEATREPVWQRRATDIAAAMLSRFRQGSELKTTQAGGELPLAPPQAGDGAMPSGRSAALALLLRLSATTGDLAHRAAAAGLVADPLLATRPERWPSAVAAIVAFPPPEVGIPALPSSADHVRARGEIRRAATGDEIVVTLDIAPGYHLNANPASFDYLIPTSVAIEDVPGIEWRYPPGRLLRPRFAPDGIDTYEGTVVIAGRLPAAADRARHHRAQVRVQACDDEVCLAPETLTLVVPAASDGGTGLTGRSARRPR